MLNIRFYNFKLVLFFESDQTFGRFYFLHFFNRSPIYWAQCKLKVKIVCPHSNQPQKKSQFINWDSPAHYYKHLIFRYIQA